MYRRVKLGQRSDFFLPLSGRPEKGVYFYRLNEYNEEVEQFIQQYLKEARMRGLVIIGKLMNPDEKQLAFYSEMLGMNFAMDKNFFDQEMKQWLPRLDTRQRESVVEIGRAHV